MKVNEPVVEHVYTPTFYFDQLPNNNRHSLSQNSTTIDSNSDSVTKPTKAQWYRAAVAPVAFDEATFWQVLERWILEAPSIIPPISKVEILQTVDATAADQDTKTSMDEQNHPTNHHKRELALLDGLVPFKSVRRQLIPKRADKDPVMEEQLYYCCDVRIQEQDQNVDTTTGQGRPRVTNQAIFAPIIPRTASTTEGKADLKQEAEEDEMKILTEALPFYYPKVRGFRYGYRFDPEEAPEDKEDYHDDSHNHDRDDSEKEKDGQGKQGQGGEEKESTPAPVPALKKKHAPKNRIISRRTGWLSLDLYLNGDEGEFTDKIQYAFKELFKKLYKWGNNTTKGFTKSRVQHDVMVPKDLYLRTYARMKETHAQKWVKSWPERTDPTKFVFEDIAIAAWLVALWELERESAVADVDAMTTGSDKASRKKQTFVDLGCGNGLLTHILNEEGHKGTGVDIVSRKVWDIYGPNTELKAETLIPNETVYEGVDWIIGNHADELAPWVPIIASRSKPLTRFVVIPCCFFDLNGSRYQFAEGAPDGKYKAYQGYISRVIETCGYELQTEVLRIPSTKNIALVGMSRKRKHGSSDENIARGEGSGKGEEEGDEDDMERTQRRVDALVAKSGLFVARISDKEKQASQKAKQTAKVAKETTPPPPLSSTPSTLTSTSENKNTEDVQNIQ